MRVSDYGRGLALGLALGAVLGALLLALVVLAPPAHAGPWLCPPTRVDDQTTVLGEHARTKPALYAVFYDSVYSTCYQRITDYDSTNAGEGVTWANLVPLYSQLQAWNANQTLIWLASEDILKSPSYRKFKRLQLGGVNVRWDPTNDSIMYFSKQISIQAGKTWQKRSAFMKVNVYTEIQDTVRVFPEYPGGLEIGNEHEDLSRDGRMVVLEGYRAQSGDQGDDSSDVFVLDVKANPGNPPTTRGRKGTVRSGLSVDGCGGVDDMLMSPSGKYAMLHWGSGGCGNTCGLAAYDTAMTYVGAVYKGRGHYDLTVDQQGREFAVAGMSGADCAPNNATIWKWRIPSGYTDYIASGSVQTDSTARALINWSDAIGGAHITGRAFDTGFVVVSADMDITPACSGTASVHPTTHTAAFSQELVKLYLDSTTGSPHLERLADHKSDAWYSSSPSCSAPGCGYWAAPHATLSRDGTRLLWGSSFGAASGVCAAEAYVMDISNKARNPKFINQTVNTWRRLTAPRVKKADGTGGGAADTLAPYQSFTHAVMAPEYGGVFYWGGGGHGERQGNDVWFFNTADTTWTQMTLPDSINQNQYPIGNWTGSQSVRSRLGMYMQYSDCAACGDTPTLPTIVCPDACTIPGGFGWSLFRDPTRATASRTVLGSDGSAFTPWGRTRNGNPVTSHQYDQMAWDSRTRTFKIWNFNFTMNGQKAGGDSTYKAGLPHVSGNEQPDSWWAIRSKGRFTYDPLSKKWTMPAPADTFPDLYAGNGGGEFDPITRKTLATNYDCFHTAGYGGYCGSAAWIEDTTGTWTKVASPTFDAYGANISYDRWNKRFLAYPANANQSDLYEFNAATNAWSTITGLPDPAAGGTGLPPLGDALSAYSPKDTSLVVHGFTGNWGSNVPTWKINVSDGRWKKMNAIGEPPLNGDLTDRIQPLVYDPTNHIFIIFRWKTGGPSGNSGAGDPSATSGAFTEVWTYKSSSGDGALFPPITPAGGGGGPPPTCGSSSGL